MTKRYTPGKFIVSILKALCYFLLFFIFQVLASVAAEVFIITRVISNNPVAEIEDFADVVTRYTLKYTYEITAVSTLLTIAFLIIFFLIRKKSILKECGINPNKPKTLWPALTSGFGLQFVIILVLTVVYAFFPSFREIQDSFSEFNEQLMAANPSPFWEAVVIIVFAPVIEEVIFRGLVFSRMKKGMPAALALVLQAMLFGAAHGNLFQFSYAAVLGLILGGVALLYDSIIPSILMHLAFNATSYLLSYVENVNDSLMTLIVLFSVILSTVSIYMITVYGKELKGEREIKAFAAANPATSQFFDSVGNSHVNINLDNRTNGDKINIQGEQSLQDMADFKTGAVQYIVAGLGNPGQKYALTRHNCGFMSLDYIAQKENIKINNSRFNALCEQAFIGDKKVLFMKPQTFMNSSGEAIREAMNFYKIPPENLIVIFDDINFDTGVLRVKKNGSAGGHNGVKSIIQQIQSEAFPRIKIGIGNIPEGYELIGWVLGNLSAKEQEKIFQSFENVYTAVKLIIEGNIDKAMNNINGLESHALKTN